MAAYMNGNDGCRMNSSGDRILVGRTKEKNFFQMAHIRALLGLATQKAKQRGDSSGPV